MIAELFGEGLELVLGGMTVVFILLGLLVLATQGLSWALRRFEHAAAPALPANAPAADDSDLVAVIAAAIHEHRTRTRR